MSVRRVGICVWLLGLITLVLAFILGMVYYV